MTTRYAVQDYKTQRYLVLVTFEGEVLPIWVEERARASTWASMTDATDAVLREVDLPGEGPWGVIPLVDWRER